MARARNKNSFAGEMTRTEVENAIWEANLGAEDEDIAEMYYIDQLPMIEIAAEMELDRKTVGARLQRIENKILRTVKLR